MQELESYMRELRLHGMRASLHERLRYALDQKISFVDFLQLLLEDELVARNGTGYQRRLKQSRLQPHKRLDTYEFSHQPQLDTRLVSELATMRFVSSNHNIILMGKPGVGKTHLANALGLKAIEQGHKVLFIHANELIDELQRSRATDSYQRVLKKLIGYDLLIIDELGFKAFTARGTDDFFEIIRRRYEIRSTIITTNRDFQGWDTILGDTVIASAVIDRLVHHSHVIKILGDSYRLKTFTKGSPENDSNLVETLEENPLD
jgi:DNA replication protein DnaC